MLYTSLLLPLAVSAAVLQERQGLAQIFGGGKVYSVTSEELVPRYRKTAKRTLYKIGRKYHYSLSVT